MPGPDVTGTESTICPDLTRRVCKDWEPEPKGVPSMLLRNHPLLTYWNGRSWPPDWLWCGGFDNTHPRGEVGILKTVFVSSVKPSSSCFLVMEHAGAEYLGEFFVSDAAFCLEMYAVLLRNCDKTIQEIGDINLSDTSQHLPENPRA